MMKDVSSAVCLFFFFQYLYKSFGNNYQCQLTFFKPSGFTNREILTPIQMYMAMAKKPAFKFRATTDNAIICCMYVCMYVCMYTCNNFGNAETPLPQKFLILNHCSYYSCKFPPSTHKITDQLNKTQLHTV